MKISRFIGDPTGYRIHPDDEPLALVRGYELGWVRAYIGISDKFVEINLAQAYVIETRDDAE